MQARGAFSGKTLDTRPVWTKNRTVLGRHYDVRKALGIYSHQVSLILDLERLAEPAPRFRGDADAVRRPVRAQALGRAAVGAGDGGLHRQCCHRGAARAAWRTAVEPGLTGRCKPPDACLGPGRRTKNTPPRRRAPDAPVEGMPAPSARRPSTGRGASKRNRTARVTGAPARTGQGPCPCSVVSRGHGRPKLCLASK